MNLDMVAVFMKTKSFRGTCNKCGKYGHKVPTAEAITTTLADPTLEVIFLEIKVESTVATESTTHMANLATLKEIVGCSPSKKMPILHQISWRTKYQILLARVSLKSIGLLQRLIRSLLKYLTISRTTFHPI